MFLLQFLLDFDDGMTMKYISLIPFITWKKLLSFCILGRIEDGFSSKLTIVRGSYILDTNKII